MRPRILVVEDEENVAFVVCTALRLAGYTTVETTSGRDALQVVSADEEFDLIVLDVMLPDLDGFEVCRRLRFDRSEIPVIFLTASDTVEDRVRGLSIGGDDYLAKPFSVEELIARVEAILRRSGKSIESQLLVCRDLVLDDEAHQVSRKGKTVELSLTEYKLLRFLMRNAGHVMTRAQILDHVWSYDFNGESTVVETYISLLRRKVDAEPPHLIHTVRGVGYRLNSR
ncbi:MAG: response regulator transcription factor [Acidimicrobiales bacterium]|jgi:two-component system OmpR family response regulator